MLMGPRACMVGLAAMLPPGIERTSKPSAPHPRRCPLLEVKRTCSGLRKMSAYDPKRTWSGLGKMSAYDPKRLKIVALQLDLRTPFRRWQIPGVINPCWRTPEPPARQCGDAISSKVLLERQPPGRSRRERNNRQC